MQKEIKGMTEALVRGNASANNGHSARQISDVYPANNTDTFALNYDDWCVATNPLAIEQIADALYEQFSDIVQKKSLAFNIHIQPGIPAQLLGDSRTIQLILGNLLINAIQHTYMGGVTLIIRQSAASAKEGFSSLLFEVSDSGTGIAERDLQFLMQMPFGARSSADSSLKRRTTGGLFVSRFLAGKIGGTLKAESIRHRGSVFSLEIRLAVG